MLHFFLMNQECCSSLRYVLQGFGCREVAGVDTKVMGGGRGRMQVCAHWWPSGMPGHSQSLWDKQFIFEAFSSALSAMLRMHMSREGHFEYFTANTMMVEGVFW